MDVINAPPMNLEENLIILKLMKEIESIKSYAKMLTESPADIVVDVQSVRTMNYIMCEGKDRERHSRQVQTEECSKQESTVHQIRFK